MFTLHKRDIFVYYHQTTLVQVAATHEVANRMLWICVQYRFIVWCFDKRNMQCGLDIRVY